MSRILNNLTDEEIEEFQELFNMADTKKRGRIYTKDVKYILSLLGMNLSSKRFIFLLKEIEYDYSGSIDFGTFIAMMAKKIETNYTPDKLHKAFAYLDITQTGVVSTKALAENIGIYHKPKISEKEALALAETIDEQKTGSINYDDIVNALETK